jgi:hypothetical protein
VTIADNLTLGSDSIRNSTAGGSLFLHGDSVQLRSQTSNHSLLTAARSGGVALYYNNSSKLSTVDTGVNVTGMTTGVATGNAASFGDGTRAFRVFTDSDEVSLLADGSVPMKFYTSGAEKMRLDTSGNLGIGTSSPSQKLDVNGTVKIGDTLILKEDGTNDLIKSTGNVLYVKAPEVNFQDNSGNNLFFTTNSRDFIVQNNVGIGTSSPSAALHVLSSTTLTAKFQGATNAYIDFTDGSVESRIQNSGGLYIGTETNHSTNLKTNGSVRLSVGGTGNIGIGTSSPAHKLTLAGGNFVLDNAYGVYFGDGNTGMSGRGSADTESHVAWRTNGSERARIDSSGRVGIGTSSPDSNLQIMNNDGSSYRFGYGGSSDVYLDADNVYIRTDNGGANTATFTTTGLGIGTTSPSHKLEVVIADTSSTPEILIGNGDSSARSALIRNQNDASEFDIIASASSSANKAMRFFTADGSSYERMRIDADGNVGIGETSPLGKLHIKEDDSGASSVNSNFDQLVLEDDSHSGMTILSGTSSDGGIYFGDSGSNDIGQIKYKHSSNHLDFTTNSVNNLRLESTGKLTVDPAGNFFDDNAGVLQLRASVATGGWGISARSTLTTSTGYWYIGKQSNGTNVFSLTSDSDSIDLSFLSDERMKMNITDSADVLDKVKQITVKDFDWRTELDGDTKDNTRETKKYGFIAQNFQSIGLGQYVKELMPTDENDDTLGMDYGNITPILVKAIQEQQAIIEDLQTQINNLRGK